VARSTNQAGIDTEGQRQADGHSGIPIIRDRALQGMVKNALEPSWEAQFEGASYGFRPGRSTQDAIGRVSQLSLPNRRKKWVVDADIEGRSTTSITNTCSTPLARHPEGS
jgi:retron-type reverse transcriptase